MTGWHDRGTRPGTTIALLLAVAVGGCGVLPRAVAARAGGEARPGWVGPCPPPLVFGAKVRPRGVRVRNGTGEPVMVFLDRCRGHDRVADLPAGETRVFPLPDRLVETNGGLTFHSFLKRSLRYHSAVTLPVDTVAVLELELGPWSKVAECQPVVYVNGVVWERPVSEIQGVIEGVSVREPAAPGACRTYRFRTK